MLLRVTDSEPNALNTNDFFSQPSVSQILEILIHKNTQYYPSTIRDNIYISTKRWHASQKQQQVILICPSGEVH